MLANYELENQILEEENKKLKELVIILDERAEAKWKEILRLQDELFTKNEDLKELIEVNNDYLGRVFKHKRIGLPYCNRTFECLSVRLKMPQFTCITLQPLFEAYPEVEAVISKKARTGFYQDMIELQNFLLTYAYEHLYKGLAITQEYFYCMDEPAGFLKAQINMTQCSMDRGKILRLLDYGMIDYIIFNRPAEACVFGEKWKLTVGNITTTESVQAQIYSFPPKSQGITEEPTKHEVS